MLRPETLSQDFKVERCVQRDPLNPGKEKTKWGPKVELRDFAQELLHFVVLGICNACSVGNMCWPPLFFFLVPCCIA